MKDLGEFIKLVSDIEANGVDTSKFTAMTETEKMLLNDVNSTHTPDRAALIARLRDYTYEGDPRHLMEAAAAMLEADGKAQQQEPTGKQSLQVAKHRTTGWMAPVGRYAVPVLFNPYTGEPRDVRDVQSDPQGILIVPPGKVEMLAAPQPQRPRLSDEEIDALGAGNNYPGTLPGMRNFARAIERKVRGEA